MLVNCGLEGIHAKSGLSFLDIDYLLTLQQTLFLTAGHNACSCLLVIILDTAPSLCIVIVLCSHSWMNTIALKVTVEVPARKYNMGRKLIKQHDLLTDSTKNLDELSQCFFVCRVNILQSHLEFRFHGIVL